MQTTEYLHPLREAELFVAAAQLLQGHAVTVGGLRLCRDLNLNLIWSTDAYGLDGIAAQRCDAEGCVQALRWALAQPPEPFFAPCSTAISP